MLDEPEVALLAHVSLCRVDPETNTRVHDDCYG